MFEKLKKYLEQGKSMLEDAFVEPEDDFVTVPEGVTEEQLIDEARQYVEAIIVKRPEGNKEGSGESPSVFLKTGDADRKSYEVPDVQEPDDDTSDKETGKTDEPEEGEHEADQPKDEDAACRPENDMRPEAEADETVPPEPEDTDK